MTEKRAAELPFAPALDLDAVRTVRVGTALWALALIVLLPFNERLADAGNTWWLWTCVAGVILGLMGVRSYDSTTCSSRRAIVSELVEVSFVTSELSKLRLCQHSS